MNKPTSEMIEKTRQLNDAEYREKSKEKSRKYYDYGRNKQRIAESI